MGTGAVRGHISENTPEEAEDTSKAVMACESCAVTFNFFKRKKICQECRLHFCATCLPREPRLAKNQRHCQKCRALLTGSLGYNELMQLKMQELRQFLARHSISTQQCTEKNDLVELILEHYGGDLYQSQQEENRRHIQELTMRQNEDENPPPSAPSSESSSNASLDEHADTHADEAPPRSPADTPQQTDQSVPKKRIKLDDIENIEHIEALTNRQLKEILACNFVDFKGCCERWELEGRCRKLWCENEKNKEKAKEAEITEAERGVRSEDICKICIDAVIDCVLLECGHMITCTKCGKQLSECPICRQYVVRVVHTFKA